MRGDQIPHVLRASKREAIKCANELPAWSHNAANRNVVTGRLEKRRPDHLDRFILMQGP